VELVAIHGGLCFRNPGNTDTNERELIEMTANRSNLLIIAALVTATLAVAGCSNSSSSVTGGGNAQGTPTANAEQFAQCMRAHGVSNFPDPTAQGTFDLPSNVTNSPQFAAADTACKSLAPPGALSNQAPTSANLEKATKFAACMRKHGETSFPDPGPDGKFSGGVTSVDPNSPQFKTAMSACRTLLPAGTGFGSGH
jgi:hypothetical protein